MVARPFLSILVPLAVAVAATLASAPTGASDPTCDRYAWPNYPAQCLTSEDGTVTTKIGRKIAPGSPDTQGAEAMMVVAREPGVASIAASNDPAPRSAGLIELSGVATAFDPFAGSAHARRVDADLQPTAPGQESVEVAKLSPVYVEVTIWRGKQPTTYQVRNNQ